MIVTVGNDKVPSVITPVSGSDQCEDKVIGGEALWDLQARILERTCIEIRNSYDRSQVGGEEQRMRGENQEMSRTDSPF